MCLSPEYRWAVYFTVERVWLWGHRFVCTGRHGRGDTDGATRRSRMQDAPIVVGIDGSSDSRQALQWAVDFARRYNIALRAMTVWDTPPTYGRVTYAAPGSSHSQSEARAMLADVVRAVVGDEASVSQRIEQGDPGPVLDRKSTRLNSSHVAISYAVFCLKKKKKQQQKT